jgi:acyl-homoserine lactone acylase PvdQ
VYTNNLAYNCGTNIWTVGSMANTVTGNPLLTNYKNDGSGDYHLQGGSPAVDRGTGTNAPSMDADGVSRPQGSGMDIGAFEYRQ